MTKKGSTVNDSAVAQTPVDVSRKAAAESTFISDSRFHAHGFYSGERPVTQRTNPQIPSYRATHTSPVQTILPKVLTLNNILLKKHKNKNQMGKK